MSHGSHGTGVLHGRNRAWRQEREEGEQGMQRDDRIGGACTTPTDTMVVTLPVPTPDHGGQITGKIPRSDAKERDAKH